MGPSGLTVVLHGGFNTREVVLHSSGLSREVI